MPGGTESIFPLLHIVEQGFGKRRGYVVEVFAGVLTYAGSNLFRQPQRVFKEP